METVDEIHFSFHRFFWGFEIFSVVLFSIEYGLRIWTADLNKNFSGRIQFLFSPLMIFDLTVIIPFFAIIFFPFFDARFLRIFRLVRIFRVFRLARYSNAMERIWGVLHREKDELLAISSILISLVFFSSTLVFLAEKDINPDFSSIPAAFWWAMATLTTIGYGDIVPITAIGKIFGALTAVIGLGIFALITGLLGASFYQEVTEKRQRKLRSELGKIKSLTEEHGEEIDAFVKKQHGKVFELKAQLKKIREVAAENGIDFSELEK